MTSKAISVRSGVRVTAPRRPLVQPGDKVIIISYAVLAESEVAAFEPVVVTVDENNHPTEAPPRRAVSAGHERPC